MCVFKITVHLKLASKIFWEVLSEIYSWVLQFRSKVADNKTVPTKISFRNFLADWKLLGGVQNRLFTLRKKGPYSELFWPIFSCIRTGYKEIRSISRSISNMVITYRSVLVFERKKMNCQEGIIWIFGSGVLHSFYD